MCACVFVGSLVSAQYVVYDYKASIKRMDLQLGNYKYSPDVYDAKDTVTVPWDSYTTAKDTLKGYLVLPVCAGCNEDGTDTSIGNSALLIVTRKGDKSKGVMALYPSVSSAVFGKTVGGRPADDELAAGPFSMKKLNEAWMSMSYAIPAIDDVYQSTKFGDIPAGFLGMGSVEANVMHAGFGKVESVTPKSDPGLCGNVDPESSCLTLKSVSGDLVGETAQTYVCELSIWDMCSFTLDTPAGAIVDSAVLHGSWSVKYNKKATADVNGLSDEDDLFDYLKSKLGGKYWMGEESEEPPYQD